MAGLLMAAIASGLASGIASSVGPGVFEYFFGRREAPIHNAMSALMESPQLYETTKSTMPWHPTLEMVDGVPFIAHGYFLNGSRWIQRLFLLLFSARKVLLLSVLCIILLCYTCYSIREQFRDTQRSFFRHVREVLIMTPRAPLVLSRDMVNTINTVVDGLGTIAQGIGHLQNHLPYQLGNLQTDFEFRSNVLQTEVVESRREIHELMTSHRDDLRRLMIEEIAQVKDSHTEMQDLLQSLHISETLRETHEFMDALRPLIGHLQSLSANAIVQKVTDTTHEQLREIRDVLNQVSSRVAHLDQTKITQQLQGIEEKLLVQGENVLTMQRELKDLRERISYQDKTTSQINPSEIGAMISTDEPQEPSDSNETQTEPSGIAHEEHTSGAQETAAPEAISASVATSESSTHGPAADPEKPSTCEVKETTSSTVQDTLSNTSGSRRQPVDPKDWSRAVQDDDKKPQTQEEGNGSDVEPAPIYKQTSIITRAGPSPGSRVQVGQQTSRHGP